MILPLLCVTLIFSVLNCFLCHWLIYLYADVLIMCTSTVSTGDVLLMSFSARKKNPFCYNLCFPHYKMLEFMHLCY